MTSSLSYQIGGFTFTLANQINYFHGIPINAGGYEFDTDLEQEILTEGLKVTKTFGGHLFVDASISRNDFLQEAAVDHYWTPSAGVGCRFNDRAGLRVGYRGDFGPHFTVNGGDLQFYVNY